MKRIMIVGGSGSGKSTLARQVGAITNLPVVHIDKMYWLPNWVLRDGDDMRSLIDDAAAKATWVFEGNHSKSFSGRGDRADMIVFLDLPRRVRLWRVLTRFVTHIGQTRDDMGEGCNERLELDFLVNFVWRYHKRGRLVPLRLIETYRDKTRIEHLRTPRDVRAFLTRLEAEDVTA